MGTWIVSYHVLGGSHGSVNVEAESESEARSKGSEQVKKSYPNKQVEITGVRKAN